MNIAPLRGRRNDQRWRNARIVPHGNQAHRDTIGFGITEHASPDHNPVNGLFPRGTRIDVEPIVGLTYRKDGGLRFWHARIIAEQTWGVNPQLALGPGSAIFD